MNLGQSIFSVNPLEENYLSVITSVNTFHIVNLVNCTSQYEFDFKNEKLMKLNYFVVVLMVFYLYII